MPSHVALLRGINVGGRKRVAMADLRQVVESLGHADVATYIQSGHVVFTSNHTDTAAIAGALGRALEETLGVRSSVVVLSRAELAKVIADNPFPDEANPKQLHAIFRGAEVGAQEAAAVAAAERRARDEGGRDQAKVVGRTVYLRTPDGLGRSELAAQLARSNPTPKTGAAPPATGRPSPSCWRCWTPDAAGGAVSDLTLPCRFGDPPAVEIHPSSHAPRAQPTATRNLTSRCRNAGNRPPAQCRQGCAHGANDGWRPSPRWCLRPGSQRPPNQRVLRHSSGRCGSHGP
jgi:uncharacterized protein (DUF1697 family)